MSVIGNRRRLLQGLALWPLAARAHGRELGAVEMLIPGDAGGGWDLSARAIGRTLLDTRLAQEVAYRNIHGSAGWRCLQAFLAQPALRDAVMVQSVSLVSRRLSGVYPSGFRDLRPLACLSEEYEAVVVRPDSPLASLAELRRRIAAAPQAQAQALVLASARDSVDHLAAQLMLADVPSGPFGAHRFALRGGDADATQMLLSGAGIAMVRGYDAQLLARHRAGQLRILATSGMHRLQGDIPTWREQGVAQSFVNWRALFARRDMGADRALRWRHALDALVASPPWRDELKENCWGPRYLTDDGFQAFLEAEERRLRPMVRVLDRGMP